MSVGAPNDDTTKALTEIPDRLVCFNYYGVALTSEDVQGFHSERLVSDAISFDYCHLVSVDRECVAVASNKHACNASQRRRAYLGKQLRLIILNRYFLPASTDTTASWPAVGSALLRPSPLIRVVSGVLRSRLAS
jgi:hypothetical protein